MAARPPRSSAGCWTCRLRRKKCDEARPVCEGCAALEIECLYSEARPSWMDNGPRQRAMADRLKLAVKDRAAWRREKRFLRDIETGAAAISLGGGGGGSGEKAAGTAHIFSVSSSSSPFAVPPTASTASTAPMVSAPASRTEHQGTSSATSSTSPNTPTDDSTGSNTGCVNCAGNEDGAATAASSSSSSSSPWWLFDKSEASLAPPSLERERELNLMMIYLDFVFPFLYPFCRPTVLSSGRGWLLVLLMKNKAVFHSALSLSSYYMAVVATTTASLHAAAQHGGGGGGGGHGAVGAHRRPPVAVPSVSAAVDNGGSGSGDHSGCLPAMAAELHKQQELSLRELQRTISAISRCQPHLSTHINTEHLAESARALESILHLLSFEVVLQRFDSWQVHLDAALALFEQMLRQSSECAPPGKQPWEHMMDRLSPFDRAALAAQRPPFPMPHGSDQAALQFYASLLFYMDTVTSTITATPPRLQRYQHYLVAPDNCGGSKEQTKAATNGHLQGLWAIQDPAVAFYLNPEEVVGIDSWVLLALADAVALAAWKKDAVAAKRLNVAELLARAAPIEQRLRGHIAALEAKLQRRAAAARGGFPRDAPPTFPLSAGFYSRYIAAAEVQINEYFESQRNAVIYGTDGGDTSSSSSSNNNNNNNNNKDDDGTHIPSLPAPPHADSAAHLSVETVSHIWGLGVLTYLLVVVNGWQPKADGVRQAADRTLAQLAALPSASCLRVAAWPLCVAGCLATTPQQRALYPGMVSEICGGELFGTVNEALRIMEAVWAAQRAEGDGAARSTEWDFARCFNILGRRAFLL
ncbi:hypothetical protein SCUCBS95973_007798 [Sporothrix curviconia]|uniref:Zn(2)-C6 fungal-type domain-containing protein n=1 Tax=Sporothrix curviconia TaxID=1260050 RepID=A0ABP0CGA1_9PEZI